LRRSRFCLSACLAGLGISNSGNLYSSACVLESVCLAGAAVSACLLASVIVIVVIGHSLSLSPGGLVFQRFLRRKCEVLETV
jgi:hypothetical protein